MTRKLLLLATVGATIISGAPAQAQDGNEQSVRPTLDYFLTRTRAGAVVNELILRCPSAANRAPLIATTIAITGKTRPDPAHFIHVDASGAFLTSRTTKLGLRADGTLSSFNATTEGQGGEVLSAAIGVLTTVAGMAVGVPPLPVMAASDTRPLHCNAQTEERVRRMNQIETDLANLRSRIATGGESSVSAQVLTDLNAELADLVGQLTLDSATRFDPERAAFEAPPVSPNAQPIPAPEQLAQGIAMVDYGSWFVERDGALQRGLEETEVNGRHGYLATLTPDRAMFNALEGSGRALPAAGKMTRFLFYRRPVPAAIAVTSCRDPLQANRCTIDTGPNAVSKRETVQLAQLSGPYSIGIGRGSIFGTRSASATFDEQGAPLTLEYGASTGGAAIAGVINAGGSSLTTLRDAQTAAITRRLAREKALHDLNELLNAPEPAAAQ